MQKPYSILILLVEKIKGLQKITILSKVVACYSHTLQHDLNEKVKVNKL